MESQSDKKGQGAIPGFTRGVVTFTLLVVNTLFWALFLFPFAALKLVFRSESGKNAINAILNQIGLCWIACNNFNLRFTQRITWNVTGLEGLNPKGWYLVLSNHQSWVDILVLQKITHRKIPFLKFFLKKELIWVPILGPAWWALEFPFMKRYSKKFLAKYPHLEGKDLEITRKACERFKKMPISVMNFVEGTRFTKEKHAKQQSPFSHLLKPKAGGISFVLSAMGEQLTHIVDITIIYPDGVKPLWNFLCSNTNEVVVNVKVVPITPALLGDYTNDAEYRERFQQWLNSMWEGKDRFIDDFFRINRRAA